MTTSRSVLLISAIALILAAFIPAVSALEVIYDEPLTEYISMSKTGIQTPSTTGEPGYGFSNHFGFWDITKAQDLKYLIFEVPGDQGYWLAYGTKIPAGTHEFSYRPLDSSSWSHGVLKLQRKTDSSGTVTVFNLSFPNWNIGNRKGTVIYTTDVKFITDGSPPKGSTVVSETNAFLSHDGTTKAPTGQPITITEVTGIDWKHHLKVEEHLSVYYIVINGLIDGQTFTSDVVLKKGATTHSTYKISGERLELAVPTSEIDILEIISPSGTRYVYPLFGDIPVDPNTSPVGVYVKSSQTGALLADAQIIIKDTSTDPWREVVNRVLPSGQGTFYLANDPGFNPTQYHITAKLPGYQPVNPAHFFRVTGPMSVVVEMEPIEGGPVEEDNAFLEFYVRNLEGNPISNAQVYVAGQMRWTNAQGFTQFEVPKNTGYSYTVSKSGYVTVKGSATVGDGPRYTVNVVLGPETVPTQPPGTDPGTSPVNVYVKSSQTGALLADARVIIKDTSTDPWREVVNQTLTSGYGTFYLANDPGFNPTQYHITAILPGYEPVYPALFFRVTGTTNVVVEMEPIEGGPVDENNTFLEFYVRNLDDNPVSNAMVSVAGQTRWTNAQGWTQFEVPKNASYPYTVSKSGYATIEGTATVGDGPRYVVNVVLGPKDIPTQPPGPGVPTLEPTPPGGIPGDDGSEGFLSEAIRGIGKIFGVGFATAKTILGMLLALAIGFTTAKKLRGGAAEFGLGLLGGTMLGVLIGLLPVWTVVVLLLIVGMYIGYRYVGGGNNG